MTAARATLLRISYPRLQCSLPPVLQVHRISLDPLAVPALWTVTHLPDWLPRMVPSDWYENCWFAPPLQPQISTIVPLAVAPPGASRHLPSTRSVPPVAVKCWFAPLPQVEICSWVPLVVLALGSSMHLPEPTPMNRFPPPPPPPDGVGVGVGVGVPLPPRPILLPRLSRAFWTMAWALLFRVELVPFTTQDEPEKIVPVTPSSTPPVVPL